MAIHRSRKNKETPHYGFLVSWQPSQARVKGESKIIKGAESSKATKLKSAYLSEKVAEADNIKRGIVRSLIIVGIILTLEVVVYLAWNKFILL